MEVRKGELVAVVGTVGSGKSSLLSCIMGEMHKGVFDAHMVVKQFTCWINPLVSKGHAGGSLAAADVPQVSQRKSNVASTELPDDDADVDPQMAPRYPVDPPMAPRSPVDPQMAPRYPVDHITESTPCELHVKVMGYLSLKAAIGYVLPPVPDQRYHCRPVPHGYAVAGVNQVMDGSMGKGIHCDSGLDGANKVSTEPAFSTDAAVSIASAFSIGA
ncbi:hypothetical protein QYE76_038265 [Lolium multiflorum]|uniref:ABC transporter domain-containing protein n=1 Tax=Lolium multiflorum TaxID=4521 RepID=A0AAD8WQR7_LOLMU|nr:hypothetical protein QYE76_038265 [Lolium multiflorum]